MPKAWNDGDGSEPRTEEKAKVVGKFEMALPVPVPWMLKLNGFSVRPSAKLSSVVEKLRAAETPEQLFSLLVAPSAE